MRADGSPPKLWETRYWITNLIRNEVTRCRRVVSDLDAQIHNAQKNDKSCREQAPLMGARTRARKTLQLAIEQSEHWGSLRLTDPDQERT